MIRAQAVGFGEVIRAQAVGFGEMIQAQAVGLKHLSQTQMLLRFVNDLENFQYIIILNIV
jgi:hypothetical protein